MRILSLIFILTLSLTNCKEKPQMPPVEKIQQKFKNGAVSREFETIGGKIEGHMTEYYPSGKVKCQRNFVNNNEIGRTVYFFETGTIKEVQHYENGKRIDFDTVFYKSGKVRFVSEFKDGVNNGIFKEYDETGAVLDEQMFENGKRLEK